MVERNVDKIRSDDIILELKPMEGKTTISAAGQPDKRLFNGENKLHAFQDRVTGLWRLKLDSGVMPSPLQCQWTRFDMAKQAAKEYYGRRNIEITKVID